MVENCYLKYNAYIVVCIICTKNQTLYNCIFTNVCVHAEIRRCKNLLRNTAHERPLNK